MTLLEAGSAAALVLSISATKGGRRIAAMEALTVRWHIRPVADSRLPIRV